MLSSSFFKFVSVASNCLIPRALTTLLVVNSTVTPSSKRQRHFSLKSRRRHRLVNNRSYPYTCSSEAVCVEQHHSSELVIPSMDTSSDVPPLLESSTDPPTLSQHLSFHESSTNISIADSAAATLGSESFRDCSDRGQISSNSSDTDGSDEDSYVECMGQSNKSSPLPVVEGFRESDMSSDEDWIEESNENSHMRNIKCLFCDTCFETCLTLIEHCQTTHEFNLKILQKRHGMDQYSFIRLVNFIRSSSICPTELMDLDMPLWEQDKFMIPVIEDDPLLMFDFDGEPGSEIGDNYAEMESASSKELGATVKIDEQYTNFRVANAEGGHVTLTQAHFDDLHATLQRMQLKVDDSNATIKQYQKDMETMRRAMRYMVMGEKQNKEEEIVNVRDDEDDEVDSYFSGYAHFGIHHDMIADKPRTESYRDAILRNSHLMKDKVVLDLGCGTGILSMFAVQAGAAKVIGVDQSQIIFNAMAIIRENKMENQIKLVRGRIEEVTLVEPVVDILISEWMGYFLLFEGMLESVIHARNKYLAPNGIILPNTCSISMMAVGDSQRYSEVVSFWDNVYELKMLSMKPEVLREASIEIVPSDKILSEPAVVLELDLRTCSSHETEFFTAFQLTVLRDDCLTALVGSFDVAFNLDYSVVLSTSPFKEPTHWKQTVFYLPQPINVVRGQVLDCSIRVRKHSKETRWLDVSLTINGDKLKYSLS